MWKPYPKKKCFLCFLCFFLIPAAVGAFLYPDGTLSSFFQYAKKVKKTPDFQPIDSFLGPDVETLTTLFKSSNSNPNMKSRKLKCGLFLLLFKFKFCRKETLETFLFLLSHEWRIVSHGRGEGVRSPIARGDETSVWDA